MCPFVPISGVTMEDCIQCSREFGQLLAKELGVPVYLYEYSSDKSYRKTLPDIREGQYKGLPKKVNDVFVAVYVSECISLQNLLCCTEQLFLNIKLSHFCCLYYASSFCTVIQVVRNGFQCLA